MWFFTKDVPVENTFFTLYLSSKLHNIEFLNIKMLDTKPNLFRKNFFCDRIYRKIQLLNSQYANGCW